MKSLTMAALGVLLLSGCSPFNTVQLYRDYTPHQSFLRDREDCVRDAHLCIQKTYANGWFEGTPGDRLLPSRGVYLACMASRGYHRVENGFVPPVLVKMTDYPPGKDCASR
jgi:hypothetical protein